MKLFGGNNKDTNKHSNNKQDEKGTGGVPDSRPQQPGGSSGIPRQSKPREPGLQQNRTPAPNSDRPRQPYGSRREPPKRPPESRPARPPGGWAEERKPKPSGLKRGLNVLGGVVVVLLCIVLLVVVALGMWAKPPELAADEGLVIAKPSPEIAEETLPPEPDSIAPDTEQGAVQRRPNTYTFLAVGVDQEKENTDTIMVGLLDVDAGELNVFSIPRDTLVNVPGDSKKVNGIYPYHYNNALAQGDSEEDAHQKGIMALKDGIRDLVGFNIDSYMVVDMAAFVELIDTLGGIEFEIPFHMEYYDPDQELDIDFQPGIKHLNGEDALKVVRFRQGIPGSESYDDADLGRIGTQQAFLKTVAKELISVESITKLNDFAKIFAKNVDTNLKAENLLYLAQDFLKVGMEGINFYSIPGDADVVLNNGSFVSIYLNEWLNLVNEDLNPYTQDITEENVNIVTFNNGKFYSTTGQYAGDTFYRDRW